jgi:hypothetical protein
LKNSIKIKTAVVGVIIAVSTVTLFTGCQSASNPGHDAGSSNAGFSSGQMKSNSFNMTSRIQTALKGLVSKGTITQAQSDKIEPILTNAFSNHGTSSGQSRQFNGQSRSGNSSNQTSSGSYARRSGFNGNNILSSLVSNKTITQEQADAVMQAIMPQRHNGQSAQGNQSSSQ